MPRPAKRVREVKQPSASASATDIKTIGWRGILDRARSNAGQLTITNHDQPQAVILTPEAYEALHRKANAQDVALERELSQLRSSFDERLASLKQPKAAAQLREAIQSPPKLRGKVKAGASH